jgi:hypothetical protein
LARSGKNSPVSALLVVAISHKLGKEEPLRRVKPALSKVSESFSVLKVQQETGQTTVWGPSACDGAGSGRQYSGG